MGWDRAEEDHDIVSLKYVMFMFPMEARRQGRSGGEILKNSRTCHFRSNGIAPHKFVFQYHPKDMLQALGILPQATPPPENLPPRADSSSETESTVKPEDVDDEMSGSDPAERKTEYEALQSQIQDLQTHLTALSQRAKRLSDVDAENETPGRRHKRAKVEQIDAGRFFETGEVIDLT